MALWATVQSLHSEALEKIGGLYREHFPLEVRHFLADWIEKHVLENPDCLQNEQYAYTLLADLFRELESKFSMIVSDIELQQTLFNAAVTFRNQYGQNPLALFQLLRNLLDAEVKIINESKLMDAGNTGEHEIKKRLDMLRNVTWATTEKLCQLKQDQQCYVILDHEFNKLKAYLVHLQNSDTTPQNLENQIKYQKHSGEIQQRLKNQMTALMQLQQSITKGLKETVTSLLALQSRILDDELIRWQREQQLAGNSAQLQSSLEVIQTWCQGLADVLRTSQQQIMEMDRLMGLSPTGPEDALQTLKTQVTQLMTSLVKSTFIIEMQPPQVMKKENKFMSKVRLLVGGKLDVHMSPAEVTVTIINEAQVNDLLKNNNTKQTSGNILNNKGVMNFDEAKGQLSVLFRNLQLTKIKRAEKNGTKSVVDEKFSLLFSSKIKIGGSDHEVWTLSLPVVVVVHGSQEPRAWATVTWDNTFSEPCRVPFAVPEKVPWHQVADALNTKFTAATGNPLSADNMRFLAAKAFRSPHIHDYSNRCLSWFQFCKEPLPGRTFAFWDWFYAVMKLIKENLKDLWMDGNLEAFIGRREAEVMLSGFTPGTFLLRFSDSELGAVSIAWINEASEVVMVEPRTSKDLVTRSLADMIKDLAQIHYLLKTGKETVSIPKYEAFGKYWKSSETVKWGYVKPELRIHIPGIPTGASSYPNTSCTTQVHLHSLADPSSSSYAGAAGGSPGPVMSGTGSYNQQHQRSTFVA